MPWLRARPWRQIKFHRVSGHTRPLWHFGGAEKTAFMVCPSLSPITHILYQSLRASVRLLLSWRPQSGGLERRDFNNQQQRRCDDARWHAATTPSVSSSWTRSKITRASTRSTSGALLSVNGNGLAQRWRREPSRWLRRLRRHSVPWDLAEQRRERFRMCNPQSPQIL
jgi:hypothetical protein